MPALRRGLPGSFEARRGDAMRCAPASLAANRVPRSAQVSSFASIVMVAFSTFDTGQPAFASAVALSNAALSPPGIFTATSRCTAVIVKPPPSLSSVTVAVVPMRSGVIPALPSSADKAIEKQPACAAAISSSGLVPMPSAKRVENEYWVSLRTPLSVEIEPLPSCRPPCQTADALRFIALSCVPCFARSTTEDDVRRDGRARRFAVQASVRGAQGGFLRACVARRRRGGRGPNFIISASVCRRRDEPTVGRRQTRIPPITSKPVTIFHRKGAFLPNAETIDWFQQIGARNFQLIYQQSK